ncbi:MAG: DUF2971 domain-containing protein [Daejeonella sp.]
MKKHQLAVRKEWGDRVDGVDWNTIYKKLQLKRIATSKICCFSLVNNHPLLWAHYADKHRGVCLVFNNTIRPRLKNNFEEFLKIDGRVMYQSFTKLNYCTDIIEGLIHLFAVKGKDWKYEKEHRYILYDCNTDYFDFAPGFLTGVIFGMKVRNKEIHSFQKEVKQLGLNLTFEKAFKENESLSIKNFSKPDPELVDQKRVNVSIVSQDLVLQKQIKAIFDEMSRKG